WIIFMNSGNAGVLVMGFANHFGEDTNRPLSLYIFWAYTPIMNGILIAFTVPTGKNKTKSSAFVKAFYGQDTSSHHGKYKYRRHGILDDIPHNKLIRGVIVVRSKDADTVIEFLKKESASYHIQVVEFSEEDCKVIGLYPE
ncbi:MAG: hypothetical protein SCH70_14945, partial [Candidatus Methanoperedens sp.]|nr:hypothetical protein [Candidatus Methanoperedens sp.]